jgi:hypothetical protein
MIYKMLDSTQSIVVKRELMRRAKNTGVLSVWPKKDLLLSTHFDLIFFL